ncbi:hypothetical protein ZIOFF_057604 [Zingiber officinale]|uniref:Plectin/eS10 N-terminal domain-containing protein n=1 Tax=Zingiber officinale TaxID=94328 RepID=A0A8J5F3K8_ZINOF|nr:hypothetical protein ZIOFF_057604 [Zingiber officinale]
MIIPKKNRHEICKYLFQEGVLYAKKDYNLAKHPEIDVPNLQVIKLMQSFKSREYVRETFAWQHYYWYLTNDGIEFLRTYLNLPSEIVPATLKKSARPPARPFGSGPPGDRPRGPPRFEGDRPRFGDRDGYRGGPRPGGPPGEAGDKGGAPPEFQPSFRVYFSTLNWCRWWAAWIWPRRWRIWRWFCVCYIPVDLAKVTLCAQTHRALSDAFALVIIELIGVCSICSSDA